MERGGVRNGHLGNCIGFPMLIVSFIPLFAQTSLVSDPLYWTIEKLCLGRKNDLKVENRSMCLTIFLSS